MNKIFLINILISSIATGCTTKNSFQPYSKKSAEVNKEIIENNSSKLEKDSSEIENKFRYLSPLGKIKLAEKVLKTGKDVELAIGYLKTMAEGGDMKAMFQLGKAYHYGEGVEKKPTEAIKWFSSAANKGHYQASAYLGDIYRLGESIKKDKTKAIYWYKQAILSRFKDKKIIEAYSNLIKIYSLGEKESNEAIRYLLPVAANGGYIKYDNETQELARNTLKNLFLKNAEKYTNQINLDPRHIGIPVLYAIFEPTKLSIVVTNITFNNGNCRNLSSNKWSYFEYGAELQLQPSCDHIYKIELDTLNYGKVVFR